MADKKVEKALYGPSTAEVAIGAILGLVVGVVVASVYLVFKPVMVVKEVPKEPVRGAVYYIPGSEAGAKNKGWNAMLKQFTSGTSIEVIEDELNAWAPTLGAPAAAPATAPKAGVPAPAAAPAANADGGILQPGTPNFKIADGKLRIGFKCVLNWYGLNHEVFVITTGGFQRSGDKFVFKPETLYLGSCPLHLLPGVIDPLFGHLLGKKPVPDEIRSAWAKLGDVAIEGSTLKLSVQ
jgi:hypothetical protein